MPKKTSKKAPKPLASALTVANPVNYTLEAMSDREGTPTRQAPEKPARGDQAPMPRLSQAPPTLFSLNHPDAQRVSLCGEFNGWSPDATAMKRHDGGRWETRLALPPGRYQYKFVVDGQWMLDPAAKENVANQYGSLNSVIEVTA